MIHYYLIKLLEVEMRSNALSFYDKSVMEAAKSMGKNIRIGRVRRNETQQDFALRCNVSKPTLVAMEKGSLSTSLGCYLSALHALNMVEDVANLAMPEKDTLGTNASINALPERVRKKDQQVIDNDF